jgi:uncharacterized protein
LRTAVIDSGPLINLVHLDLALQLPVFFERVYVPRAVQREVNVKGRFRYRLRKLYATGFFERCVTADETNVRLLRADLGEGESEALIQAQERRSYAFISDDRQARRIADRMARKSIGTVRLLARLHLEGRAAEPPELVKVLRRDLDFRITDHLVAEAIAIASEPI